MGRVLKFIPKQGQLHLHIQHNQPKMKKPENMESWNHRDWKRPWKSFIPTIDPTSYRLQCETQCFVSPVGVLQLFIGTQLCFALEIHGDVSSSTALLLQGNKSVQGLNCKREFEWEGTSILLNSTQGALGRTSSGRSARGKIFPFILKRGEKKKTQNWELLQISRSWTKGQFLLLLCSDRNTSHLSDFRDPAWLLGELLRGTATCLALLPPRAEPAESLPKCLRNKQQRRFSLHP